MKLTVVSESNGMFGVYVETGRLHTGMGGHHPVLHRNSHFMQHMVTELQNRGELRFANGELIEPKGFDSYNLFSLQKDWVEPGRDNLTTDFILEMIHEPLFEQSANPETWHILPFRESANAWLSNLGARLVDLDFVDHSILDGVPDEHFRVNSNMGDDDNESFLILMDALVRLYGGFSNEQKSVATYLTNIFDHFLIYSLRLAAGQCSPEEFGMASAAVRQFDSDEVDMETEARRVTELASRAVRFLELSTL
jgi:hypothetical protein